MKKALWALAVVGGIGLMTVCERGKFDHDNAMSVKAVITDLTPYYGGGYGSKYKAVYEYSVNGDTYTSSDEIDQGTYKRLNIGDTVTVLVNNKNHTETELQLERNKIVHFHIDF